MLQIKHDHCFHLEHGAEEDLHDSLDNGPDQPGVPDTCHGTAPDELLQPVVVLHPWP